jgi:transketolase
VILSDGELDEGSNWEAILFAAHHKLDNLTIVIDYNKMQSFGTVSAVRSLDPLADKFRAFNWDVTEVDGHSIDELQSQLSKSNLGVLEDETQIEIVSVKPTKQGQEDSYDVEFKLEEAASYVSHNNHIKYEKLDNNLSLTDNVQGIDIDAGTTPTAGSKSFQTMLERAITTGGTTIDVVNVGLFTKITTKKEKAILQNIYTTFQPGKLNAVMGGSGSGQKILDQSHYNLL